MKINPLKRLHIVFLTFLTSLLFPSFTNNYSVNQYRIKTIVIDAGHGGKAVGALGKYSTEKKITLQVALRLGKAITNTFPDVRVLYTRTSDVFVPNENRTNLANRTKADLFISIHCNSMPSSKTNRTSIKGAETFVAGFGRIDEQDVAIRENADILLEKDYKSKNTICNLFNGFIFINFELAFIIAKIIFIIKFEIYQKVFCEKPVFDRTNIIKP